jgi:quercetin dioxygenase-like cupin family protein
MSMAVPSSQPGRVTTEQLGGGVTLGEFTIAADRVKFLSKCAVEFSVSRLTYAPGGSSGWQLPRGPALVIVTNGALTKYDADDSTAQTFRAGQTVVLSGPCEQNMLRNEGTAPAEAIVIFITPTETEQASTCPP